MELLKKSKLPILIFSVIFTVSGVVLILYPEKSLDAICRIIGVLAVLLGIYNVLRFFLKYGTNFQIAVDLIVGIFSAACGLILLCNPSYIRNIFFIVTGIFILIDSAFKLMTAFELKNVRAKIWYCVFFLSLFGIALGLIIIMKPSFFAELIPVITGLSLIVDGIENIIALIFSVKALKKKSPIEASFREIEPSGQNAESKDEANNETDIK